jgi:hypothetical protein
LLFGLCRSMWIIELLVTLLSSHPRAPAHPSTLKVLRAKERAPTPYPSTIFTLDSHLSLSRSLGVHQMCLQVSPENYKSLEKNLCTQMPFTSVNGCKRLRVSIKRALLHLWISNFDISWFIICFRFDLRLYIPTSFLYFHLEFKFWSSFHWSWL